MRILLVEDNRDVARAIVAMLERERYEPLWAVTLEEAYRFLSEAEPDLLILDVMLPESNDAGFELTKHMRTMGYQKPILFLTARDAVEDRIEGLNLGGDDYLTKPFDMGELIARIRALIRRDAQTRSNKFVRGPLSVDLGLRRVFLENSEIVLTEKEFSLLEIFVLQPDRVFRIEELVVRIFPNAQSGRYTVRMYIMRLREKLSAGAFLTVPGGYRLGF